MIKNSLMNTNIYREFVVSRAWRFSYFVLMALSLVLYPSSLLHAQDSQTVVAEGIAPVVEGNKAIARDGAISDALRKAVEQAVGTMISAETVVQNFQMLSDTVYSKSQGYIRSYKIISEGVPEPDIYKVTVQAEVNIGGLKDDIAGLGIILQQKGMPRILFMIAEQNVGRTSFVYWWSYWGRKADFVAMQGEMNVAEHTLTEKFLEKGFNIVDHNVQTKNITLSQAYGVVDMTDSTARTIGRELDAEVVIYGKAVAKLAGNVMGSGMLSSQANINAKAVRIDTGGVIASASATGAAVYSDELTAGNRALERVGAELAEKLIDQISSKWGQEVAGSTLVQMVVSGISSYSDFVKFKKELQSRVRGIQGIHQRSLNGGVAMVDVDIKGSAQSLADEMAIAQFKDFVVDVTNVSANKVELTISPKN